MEKDFENRLIDENTRMKALLLDIHAHLKAGKNLTPDDKRVFLPADADKWSKDNMPGACDLIGAALQEMAHGN